MSVGRARRVGTRLSLVAVVACLLASAPTVLPGGSTDQAVAATARAASAKKGPSWKTVRTEEFTGTALPSGCVPYTGKYVGGASAWSRKDVAIAGGLLKLTLEKKKTGGQPYRSGGVACPGWAQKYGRYEVRAKVPAGKGIDSYFTLWPSSGGDGAWTGLELLAPGPQTAYVTNGYGVKSEGARVNGQYSDAFHSYVIEWAPKHIRITVDGREIYFSTRSYKGPRWFGIVVSNGDALTGVPDAHTALPAQFQIDRVKVSSYTGVPPRAGSTGPTVNGSRVAGTPTAVPNTVPPKAANLPAAVATTKVSALQPAAERPALAGGVWPWLLGGSLIAACAIATLNYPRNRRARRLAKAAKAQARRSTKKPDGTSKRPPARTPARRG